MNSIQYEIIININNINMLSVTNVKQITKPVL